MLNLYLTPIGLNNNIIYTQLYVPLAYLSKENSNVLMFCHSAFEGYTNDDQVKMKYYSSFNEKIKFLIRNNNKIKNIYTRSLLEFYMLFFLNIIFLKKWKVRLDFRGLLSEESFLRNKSKLRRFFFEFLEYLSLRLADSISTVSFKFRDLLKEKFGCRKDIIVTPCCTNLAFFKKERINEALKFVYVGSMADWQKFTDICAAYKYISSKVDNTVFTVVTNEVEKAQIICEKYDLKPNIVTLKNHEVADFLKKQDFGFLLRDNILLNNVASPVKFLEYISSGIIPIVSPGIGDYSDLVKNNKIGIIYEGNCMSFINNLEKIKYDTELHLKLYEIAGSFLWNKYYRNFAL